MSELDRLIVVEFFIRQDLANFRELEKVECYQKWASRWVIECEKELCEVEEKIQNVVTVEKLLSH